MARADAQPSAGGVISFSQGARDNGVHRAIRQLEKRIRDILAVLPTGGGESSSETYDLFTRADNGLVPAPGGSGTTRFLREDGEWETVTAALADGDYGDVTISGAGSVIAVDANAITNGKLRDSAGTSVIGRAANSAGDPADIVAGADGAVLRRVSSTVGFGTIPQASVDDLVADLQDLQDQIDGIGGGTDGPWIGDGSDGNATITSNATLTRDWFYDDLTIDPGVVLRPGGYRIFVRGTLTLNGNISADGNNASGQTGGASGGVNGAYLTQTYGNGGNGGSSGSGAGATGPNSTTTCPRLFTAGFAAGGGVTPANNGANGATGQGGGSGNFGWPSGGGGSSGGTVNLAPANVGDIRAFPSPVTGRGTGTVNPFSGGTGGGGGRGSSTVAGTGGGGGGGGGFVIVVAKQIVGSGSITARGGNGGNASAGGDGGGGGGGGGGIVVVATKTGSFPAVDVTGGNGGSGSFDGTRTGGTGGNGGNGITLLLNL